MSAEYETIQAVKRASQINAAVGRAMIKAMGMQAENQIAEANDRPLQYFKDDFERLIDEEGISHNEVVTFLNPE